MRVALVCPYSLSVPGGVQDQVLGLSRHLRVLGHTVVVIAPWDGQPPGNDQPPGGVTAVGRSLRFRVNGSTAAMAPTPAALVRTARILARGNFDVMHLHEPLAPSITLAALLSRAAPVVGTFHAAGDRTPYKYFRVPLRRVAARIDARVAVSDAARELAQHQLGGDFETLFNGIDLCAYTDALPTPVDRPMILFLGRHEPRKGLEVLLEAFTSLPDDIALWVGGDGPERARLQSRYGADRRIRWLGRIDESAKISHLRAASVVCAPSLHGESFGMILLEAMAARTPVVASDLPGYRALGAEGAAASLVAPGDPAALVVGLRRVLSNPRLGEELRAAGSLRVAEFGLDGLAKRYEAIYRRLLLRDR